MNFAPSKAKVFLSIDASHLKCTNVMAIGEWLNVSEIPVISTLFSFLFQPFHVFIMIFGVQCIQFFDGRQHRWRLFSHSFYKCFELMTISHTLTWGMDFNAVHQEWSSFFSITDLVHEGWLAVEALGHFFLLSESCPPPSLPLWHDALLWKLVFSASCCSSGLFWRWWGFWLLLHDQSHAQQRIFHVLIVLHGALFNVVHPTTNETISNNRRVGNQLLKLLTDVPHLGSALLSLRRLTPHVFFVLDDLNVITPSICFSWSLFRSRASHRRRRRILFWFINFIHIFITRRNFDHLWMIIVVCCGRDRHSGDFLLKKKIKDSRFSQDCRHHVCFNQWNVCFLWSIPLRVDGVSRTARIAEEPEWLLQSSKATVKVCPPSTKHRRELYSKFKHSKPKFKNVAGVFGRCRWREHWFDLLFGQHCSHVIMVCNVSTIPKQSVEPSNPESTITTCLWSCFTLHSKLGQ